TRSWDDKETGQKKYMTEIIANDLIMIGGKRDGDSEGGARGGGSGFEQKAPPEDFAQSTQITDEDIPF
ncbi:MAG: single-stranded DNA-binding protein, partial [Acidobacteriales bacterium]|nr:single-stranded DNA-binding protein [Terriglobales bacterium]